MNIMSSFQLKKKETHEKYTDPSLNFDKNLSNQYFKHESDFKFC